MKDIVIVAGETSGDQLAAHLVREVRARDPSLRFHGVCGPKMRAAGVSEWFDSSTLAVRGYTEVFTALPRILRLKRELLERVRTLRPALYIGVDAPDFNLRIEKQVKAFGIKTMHYVCPSFWAWRPERAKKFSESVDHMLCVFPFEPALLAPHRVPATFVGHPLAESALADTPREELRASLSKFRSNVAIDEFIAVLPGSRVSELEYHADVFVDAIEIIARERAQARFLVPLVDRKTRAIFEAALWRRGEALAARVELMFGHADFALRAAHVGLVASGTASLEAAMLGCPHVVTYRISALTYAMVRRKLTLPYVSLPNILAKEKLVPELLQRDATPQRLAQAVLDLLGERERRENMMTRFAALREGLRIPPDAALANAVLRML